jgi:hypothetical protein
MGFRFFGAALAALALLAATGGPASRGPALAQSPEPTMLLQGAGVRRVASGLVTPIGVASIGPSAMLVIEKSTG